MRSAKRKGASLALAIAACMAIGSTACSDDAKGPAPTPDGGSSAPADAGHDAGAVPVLDASVDAQTPVDAQTLGDAQLVPDSQTPPADSAVPLQYCLPRPGSLPEAPAGRLPCDLVPPGLRL